MGRPLRKQNFGNVADAGAQLQLLADLGVGEELCWIMDQPGSRTYTVASVAGGATPTRTGRVKLQQAAIAGVGEARMEVTPYDGVANVTATATATMSLITPAINAAGTGYSVSDVLTVDGGTGISATITVDTIGGSGEVTGFTLTTSGDYSVLPTLTANAVTGGGGAGATFDFDAAVLDITITAGGSGYSVAPTVTVAGAATATATISGGAVNSITVTDGGSGYTSVPAVTISAPAAGGTVEYARTLLQHTVKTWEGNSYKWKLGVAAAASGEADLPSA